MMSKRPITPADEQPADTTTLQEWCARTSGEDRRVEMLSAFYRLETAAGRSRGTPGEFASRYDAFANRAV